MCVMLAAAILLATILYLVDKNQAWPKFWRFLKFGAIAVVIVTGIGFGWLKWSDHQAAKAAMTPDSFMEQQPPPGYTIDSPSSSSQPSKTPARSAPSPHQ